MIATLRHPLASLLRVGALRRTKPASRTFGYDRGTPIDRVYIERFLAAHAADIHGRVLEIGDTTYTQRFGGERVERADALHATGKPGTLVGDLVSGEGVPREAFDCIVLTQTLNVIFESDRVIRTCHAALRPGGVVLATVPGISQISRFDMDHWGDYWRFTTASARRLFETSFDPRAVSVASRGNVLVATAFLQGLAAHELTDAELSENDPDYQVLITIRARKAEAA